VFLPCERLRTFVPPYLFIIRTPSPHTEASSLEALSLHQLREYECSPAHAPGVFIKIVQPIPLPCKTEQSAVSRWVCGQKGLTENETADIVVWGISYDSAVNKDIPTAQNTAVSFFIGSTNESINRSIN